MNVCSKRDRTKRQRIADLGRSLFAGRHASARLQTFRCQNVAQFAVAIFDERNARRTIRIVFDADHLRGDVTLPTFEIDLAIFLLMTAADMT